MAAKPPEDPSVVSDGAARGLIRGFGWLGLALAPALIAIGLSPGFTSQDGPAHIYSARILNAALAGEPTFASSFRVAWRPLPNWAGHVATMLALRACSPEVANRVVTSLGLVAFAAAILTLRWAVAGSRGIGVAAVLAALLALNVTWLLGFTSFLIGATLFPSTLAYWWATSGESNRIAQVVLGGLLVLGYFAHPVSLGLTLLGLGVLVACGRRDGKPARAWRALISTLPLVPLGVGYLTLTRSGGGLAPVWSHVSPSLGGLISQVGWVDPLSLAAKTATPFDFRVGPLPPPLLAPAPWIVLALASLGVGTWRHRRREHWGYLLLACGLVGAGLIAPDTIGAKHGHYLPQRVVLLGLVALVPWLDLGREGPLARASHLLLMVALLIQSAFVCEYARSCRERVAPFLQIAGRFRAGEEAGTLLNGIRGKFRSNPLLHADCLVAATSDAIFWTNYETAQYYFPVQAPADLGRPPATAFEEVALLDGVRDSGRRGRLWGSLLDRHGGRLRKILEWGADAQLDALTRRDYAPTDRAGNLRLWTRRNP